MLRGKHETQTRRRHSSTWTQIHLNRSRFLASHSTSQEVGQVRLKQRLITLPTQAIAKLPQPKLMQPWRFPPRHSWLPRIQPPLKSAYRAKLAGQAMQVGPPKPMSASFHLRLRTILRYQSSLATRLGAKSTTDSSTSIAIRTERTPTAAAHGKPDTKTGRATMSAA